MADQRKATARTPSPPDDPVDDVEDLFLAFFDYFTGCLRIVSADAITEYHSEFIATRFVTVVHTGFFSYHVTASLEDITSALGITPLGVGKPEGMNPTARMVAEENATAEVTGDFDEDTGKPRTYAFTDEPLPRDHPSNGSKPK